ncbi:hypothetical protein RJ641_017019 [Dillenia turbinata]|uniref:BHLH domain-containing protein n=1 Tax=Dillenia turbinata TaxID=194707 RepID=A0AAN8V053_9MAGN
MSQCVPSWDLDDNPTRPRISICSLSNSANPDAPIDCGLNYEVAELTWENGQLSMHGLGQPRVPIKPLVTSTPSLSPSSTKYAWDNLKQPRASGTLESIVNQATLVPGVKQSLANIDDLVPWFDHHHHRSTAASATMTVDALVPCSRSEDKSGHVTGTCVAGCSTCVGSCSGVVEEETERLGGVEDARARVAAAAAAMTSAGRVTQRDASNSVSVSGSAASGRDSRQVTTADTCEREREFGVCGFTSTSLESLENTSSGEAPTKATTTDDHDSVCHSRPQREASAREDKRKAAGKSSISTKRRRAAAIHNQSERTDKASMLDEVIEYLKQLQAQVQMMSRMNMSPMMLPLTMQQQLQMSMLAQMGMSMGMGMGMGVMDMNTLPRPNLAGISPVLHPTAFMPLPTWDISGDRLSASSSMMPDPLSAYLACQSQPMTMDAYSRMAALYQQLHQPLAPATNSRN